MHNWLVVWNIFLWLSILGRIIPTDFHIFQRGRSTTNQITFVHYFASTHSYSQESRPSTTGDRLAALSRWGLTARKVASRLTFSDPGLAWSMRAWRSSRETLSMINMLINVYPWDVKWLSNGWRMDVNGMVIWFMYVYVLYYWVYQLFHKPPVFNSSNRGYQFEDSDLAWFSTTHHPDQLCYI